MMQIRISVALENLLAFYFTKCQIFLGVDQGIRKCWEEILQCELDIDEYHMKFDDML